MTLDEFSAGRGEASALAGSSIPDALSALGVDPKIGLSDAEAAVRRTRYGYNEVAERKERPLLSFLKKFWGISAWMLELIMILSAVLGKTADLAIVGALLVVNAALGFFQERRAAGVVESLRHRLQIQARVLREGEWRILQAREIVPGDIVRVRGGDIVPADIKQLTGGIDVDQSVLTGESAEIRKEPGAFLLSGSVVRRGEGNGLVLATGARTVFGRTTELVQLARPKLHIESVVARVVRALFAIVGGLLAAVIILSTIRGLPLLETAPLMLVLLMSAVPVALPAMFTISTALGARELARRGVLVTRLSAAEDAATMDVLCVDKTGTITQNRLAVVSVLPLGGAAEAEAIWAGALASREANQDPIDMAFLSSAAERRVFEGEAAVKPISFVPFDPEKRRTEAVIEKSGEKMRVMKGAVTAVAAACGLPKAVVEALSAWIDDASRKGYRTLAVARGRDPGPLEMIGLVSLSDPPRPDAGRLIAELRALGISVIMLTGDALAVARDIGRGLGLSRIKSVAELKAGEHAGDPGDADFLKGTDGFAEVFPEDKYLIVRRLQAAGRITGMTGDGINDAPALRQAEVGIAVRGAADIAKSAASVVLIDPGLTNITALVGQGRAIFQRMLTWIINKISRTILKSAFVAVAFLVTGRFVVSAFAMLLLVLMTDLAKISLAGDNVRSSPKPETWNIRGTIGISAALGLAMLAETLLLLFLAWKPFGLAESDPALSTFSFLTLLYFAAFSIVSARERKWFWSSRPSRTFCAAVSAEVIAGTAISRLGLPGLAPLPWGHIFAIFVAALFACLVVNDSLKVAMFKKFSNV